jgi:hypothetical protein
LTLRRRARYFLDALETGHDSWSGSATTSFVAGTATLSDPGAFDPVRPDNGNGYLRVETAATANSGAWWDLSGRTFQADHTYRVDARVFAASGIGYEVLLGADAAGGNSASSGTLTGSGGWQEVSFDWTPSSDVSTDVHLAIRTPTATAISINLDDVQVWDVAETDRDRDRLRRRLPRHRHCHAARRARRAAAGHDHRLRPRWAVGQRHRQCPRRVQPPDRDRGRPRWLLAAR